MNKLDLKKSLSKLNVFLLVTTICSSVGLLFVLWYIDAPGIIAYKLNNLKKQQDYQAYTEYPNSDNELVDILIIGDSISLGYTAEVRDSLAKVANVHRVPENCRDTRYALNKIDEWLGQKEWDVIHFNWGLHDIAYRIYDEPLLNKKGNTVYKSSVERGFLTSTEKQYQSRLNRLVARLKKANATLVWANTTPSPPGDTRRLSDDVVRYNQIANDIMTQNDIPVNDLYSFILPKIAEAQNPDDVHFNDTGNRYLAEQVSAYLNDLITSKP